MAARLPHEAVHHAEAKPGAANTFGREERVERLGDDLGRHARAGVADRDHDEIARHRLGILLAVIGIERHVARLDRQLAAAGHGVAGIDRQVEDGRFELCGIDQDRPERIAQLDLQHDIAAEGAGQQLAGILHHLGNRHRGRGERLAPGEGEQVARQLGTAQRRLGGALDEFLRRFRQPGQLAEEIEIAQDDGEEVVEVMRHAAGQLADRLHLLRLLQLCREAQPFCFGLLLQGDVVDDGEPRGPLRPTPASLTKVTSAQIRRPSRWR